MPTPSSTTILRRRLAAAGLLTVVVGVAAFAGTRGSDPAKTAAAPAPTEVAAVDAGPAAAASGPVDAITLPAQPPGGLYDGKRPPQFVLISFDGAADQTLLDRWDIVAHQVKAHFSFFLSMVYLLSDSNAQIYQGPRHPAGTSAINFAPIPAADKATPGLWIGNMVRGLQKAQREGHELGNHYGGHWCGPTGVKTWTKADWAAELNQVESLISSVDANNKIDPPVGNPFITGLPIGSRTPCLEGDLKQLYPVLKARGYRYDASSTRALTEWPVQRQGLWSFGFPSVQIAGSPKPMLTVDFSLWANLADSKDVTVERAKQIEDAVYDGYLAGFQQVYTGNRAPFELSNHFVHYSHDAFNNALQRLAETVCGKPEVICVNYREMSDFMDAHASQIKDFEAGKFPKMAQG